MGIGGHLLWSSVVRTLQQDSGRPVIVCEMPRASDLLRGRLHRGDLSLADDVVLRGNPRMEFPPVATKSPADRVFDRLADALIRRLGLRHAYESMVWRRTRAQIARTQQFVVHLDLPLHSYVQEERPDRLVWKPGGHIIDIILANFGRPARDHRCEMYFSAQEEQEADASLAAHGLDGDYVVIEPNSKDTWFGDLRRWPQDRWQVVVDAIAERFHLPVVQIGEGRGDPLRGVINLSGRVPFRIAVLIMKRARLFLGLDGGLSNAANAVGTPSVIVWGGTALPEFAGYPELHRIVCKRVDCAPCGLRGNCPYGKRCLTEIEASEVVNVVSEELAVAG